MKAFWTYTALRIGLFAGSAAIVYAVYAVAADTVSLLVVLLVAAVLSSVLSWWVLQGPRTRFAQSVEDRAARTTAKIEEMRSKEDAD